MPSTAPPRLSRPVIALCLPLALAGAGCDDDSPTSPQRLALSGVWSGTMAYSDGDTDCTGDVTVTFDHQGSALNGTVADPPECTSLDHVAFEGTLSGNQIHGLLIFTGFTRPATGEASSDRMTIRGGAQFELRR